MSIINDRLGFAFSHSRPKRKIRASHSCRLSPHFEPHPHWCCPPTVHTNEGNIKSDLDRTSALYKRGPSALYASSILFEFSAWLCKVNSFISCQRNNPFPGPSLGLIAAPHLLNLRIRVIDPQHRHHGCRRQENSW